MPRVYVTRKIPTIGVELLKQQPNYDVRQWDSDDPVPRDVLLQELREADGVLPLLTERFDAEAMDAAPKVKVIANMAVGFDNIVPEEATKRGIVVCNTPGVLTDTTCDLAWTLLMASARQIVPAWKYVQDGKWKTWGPLLFRGQDIHHATLGLIGLGRIGSAVAQRASGFSMKVIYYDVFRNERAEQSQGIEYKPSIEDVLREADFVSLHVPYMAETHHLMNAERFKLMKKTAVLINTARGPVVDPQALYDALTSGTIWAAGLDVTEPEPLPVTSPLLKLDNCLVVPHIASASFKTRDDMSALAARNIIAVLSGQKPETPVNPDVWDAPNRRK
jgi:glyoxylate reductase